MSLTAEILAVGSEIVSGAVVNTNAREIARALEGIGIPAAWHTAVGDDPAQLRTCLETARQRAGILITTGGLGPTLDDLTKETVCRVFRRPLALHPQGLESVRAYVQTALRRPVSEQERRQAELPEGCRVFPNSVGTAPGCAFESLGRHVLMLPGPPFEMRTMLADHALPYLRELSPGAIVSRDIMTFGLGESALETLLRPRILKGGGVRLATYARPGEVRLRLSVRAPTREEAAARLAPALAELTEYLGDIVYGVDVPDLPSTCMELLRQRGWTFAAAESCTGGLAASRITALPGASRVFRGGVVSYWTEMKEQVLGVPREVIGRHGAVSDPCARAMAQAVRRCTGAEVGLSVTGAAGPDPDERGTPVGAVFIGLDTPQGTYCRHLALGQRRRDHIRDLAVNHAYDMLRRCLTGLPVEPFDPGKPLTPLPPAPQGG